MALAAAGEEQLATEFDHKGHNGTQRLGVLRKHIAPGQTMVGLENSGDVGGRSAISKATTVGKDARPQARSAGAYCDTAVELG